MAKSPERARRGAEPRRPLRAWAPGLAVLCLGLVLATVLLWRHRGGSGAAGGPTQHRATLPPPGLEDEKTVFAQYGGSASCRNCHEEEFADWQGSHHGLAERPLAPVQDRKAFDPARSFGLGVGTTRVAWVTN